MSDEREDSTREGNPTAPGSALARDAAERQQAQLIRTPPEARTQGAMGGTSDADSPSDEAWTRLDA